MVTFYCAEIPELKLGPGDVGTDQVVRFREGFLAIADDDERLEDIRRWVSRAGTPIVELPPDEAEVRTADNDPAGHPCPKCGKSFKTEFALLGHLRVHAPKLVPVG